MSDAETIYSLADLGEIVADARVAPIVALVSPDDLLTGRIHGERAWFVGLGRSPERANWFIVTEDVLVACARTVLAATTTPEELP